MTRWIEKWLIPTTLTILLLYSVWAFNTINQTIKEYEERLATTSTEEKPVEAKAEEKTPAPEGEEVVEPQSQQLGTFKLTAYCACPQCCGAFADGITFTGTKATAGRTVAVDPSVIPLGSEVYINGQEYVAEDIGGAIKGNRIDIFFPTHAAALEFGVQYSEVSIN